MLSEEEAKKKWCPKAQVAAAADGGQQGDWWNRDGDHFDTKTNNQSNCLGSACMAWRWGPRFWIDPDEKSEPKTRYSTDHKPGMELEPAKGFCGLAEPSS